MIFKTNQNIGLQRLLGNCSVGSTLYCTYIRTFLHVNQSGSLWNICLPIMFTDLQKYYITRSQYTCTVIQQSSFNFQYMHNNYYVQCMRVWKNVSKPWYSQTNNGPSISVQTVLMTFTKRHCQMHPTPHTHTQTICKVHFRSFIDCW